MTARKLVLSALTALFFGLVPAKAAADEQRDPFEAMQGFKKLLRGAMLTEEQVAQIRALRKTQWEHAKALEAKQSALWDEFDAEYTRVGVLDPTKLAARAAEARQLRDQVEEEKVAIMIQIRALLTPEQLRRVSDVHQRTRALNDQLKAFEPAVASEDVKG